MPEITIDNWTYQTRMGDPAGALPEGWQQALTAIDFQPLGTLERKLPPLPAREPMPAVDVPRWQPPEPERIAVWGGPHVRTFAVVEPYFEEELLSLRSLTAAGEVVETTVASRRPPATPPDTLTASVFSGRWLTRAFRKEEADAEPTAGADEGWIREDRPAAGYHLELVAVDPETAPEAVAATVWEAHRARLAGLVPQAEFPHHDNLVLYLALLLRTQRVTAAAETHLDRLDQIASYLLNILGLLVAAVLPLILLLQGGLGSTLLRPFTWAGGAILLLMVTIYLLQRVLRGRLARGPLPLQPAAELVREVEER